MQSTVAWGWLQARASEPNLRGGSPVASCWSRLLPKDLAVCADLRYIEPGRCTSCAEFEPLEELLDDLPLRPKQSKTGTTNDGRDLLFIGYEPSRHWVLGIWLGNDDNSPTASSSALAAVLWGDIIRAAGRGSVTQ